MASNLRWGAFDSPKRKQVSPTRSMSTDEFVGRGSLGTEYRPGSGVVAPPPPTVPPPSMVSSDILVPLPGASQSRYDPAQAARSIEVLGGNRMDPIRSTQNISVGPDGITMTGFRTREDTEFDDVVARKQISRAEEREASIEARLALELSKKNAAEDRERRMQAEDEARSQQAMMEAFKADQMRKEIQRQDQWSAENGNIPYSKENEAIRFKRDQDIAVADEHDINYRQLNDMQAEIENELASGAPSPELAQTIEALTGEKIGQGLGLSPVDISRIGGLLSKAFDRERELVQSRRASLLGQLRITRRESDQGNEFSQ